jgi:hypothetical protein
MPHRRNVLCRTLAFAVVSIACAAALCAAAAFAAEPAAGDRSPGVHARETGNPTYKYFVYVPKSYSGDSPAGLHVYFHGQSGQGGAQHFGQWAKHFCEPLNLIGINMQYNDGDNGRDTDGKAEAAVEAIRKTAEEFRVVLGRGAVGSFSGGGLPHAKLFSRFAKLAAGGPAPCPFNHAALYGSNYWSDPTQSPPMSWYVGVGTGEWGMGQPTLGSSQVRRAEQLFAGVLKGGFPDAQFKVIAGKGHSIADEDVAASAAQFRRSDLALAPFLYEPAWKDSPLLPVVRQANTLALGQAAARLKKMAADPKADPAVKTAAEDLDRRIEARVDAILALVAELAQKDPALCGLYGRLFAQQLAGHPRAKDLAAALAEAKKRPEFAPAGAAFQQFCAKFKDVIGSGPNLAPGAGKFLEDVRTKAGPESLVGTMAADLLKLEGGK